jgi:hypothetical protein
MRFTVVMHRLGNMISEAVERARPILAERELRKDEG